MPVVVSPNGAATRVGANSGTPITDREGWTTVFLGDIEVPPIGFGTVEVDCPSAIKTNSKTSKGKPAATITKNGKEKAKVTIKVMFLAADWERNGLIEDNLDLIDPNGPLQGGPFQFTYPGLGPGAPAFIQVKKMTRPVKWSGTLGEVTIEAEETDLAVGGGGGSAGPPVGTLTEAQRLALEAERATLTFMNISDQIGLASSDVSIREAAGARVEQRNRRIDEITTLLDTSGDAIEITRLPNGQSAAPGSSTATGSVTPTAADAQSANPSKSGASAWTSGGNAPDGKP